MDFSEFLWEILFIFFIAFMIFVVVRSLGMSELKDPIVFQEGGVPRSV